MNLRKNLRSLVLTLSILFWLAATAIADSTARGWEPLVIAGSQMKPLLGIPINTLEVLGWNAGKLSPLPFQIDPATREEGTASAARCSPTAVTGLPLRPDDQMAMLLADFGDRASGATSLPPGALEIAVKDPLGGPDQYAYVAAVNHPLHSPLSYVQFDPSSERVETDFYRFGLNKGWPSDFAYQRQRFELRPSLIGRLNMSLSSRLFGIFPYAMTEHDLQIGQPEVSCGPVRVVLRYHYSVRLMGGIRSPSVTVPITFYPRYINSSVAVHFPWRPRLFFGDTRIRINVDYGAASNADLLWRGHKISLAPVQSGLTDRQNATMDPGPAVDWVALRQGKHLLAQGFPASPDLNLIKHKLTYRNSVDDSDGTQDVRQKRTIGYEISHLEKLSAGKHVFETCFAVLDESSDPQAFFDQLRTAPVVVVRPRSIAAVAELTALEPSQRTHRELAQ